MLHTPINVELPKYSRTQSSGLPTQATEWPLKTKEFKNPQTIQKVIKRCAAHSPWQWPLQPVYFIADPHADADAFLASLMASGGVRQVGPSPHHIELTDEGKAGTFIIGGDCLDKGPSNLKLLDAIRNLMGIGAKVKLLAGNHDVRLLMGIRCLQQQGNTATEHMFVRMGPKIVPLLKEVYETYLVHTNLDHIPSKDECRRYLYPRQSWFHDFPKIAAPHIPEKGIARELKRMQKKVPGFEEACEKAGLSLRHVYATAEKCRQLFLEPNGQYAWFFNRMQLTHREGSFLFVHAGLDDTVASQLADKGVDNLNACYNQQIRQDLFGFYYGPLANTMRTKYRDVDLPLSDKGVKAAASEGVHAVVHGHRNRTQGQCIALRQNMIHIEGDVTMDRYSRRKEGLPGFGSGVTIIRPEGCVIGLSNDYPYAKVFEPQRYLQQPYQSPYGKTGHS